MNYVEIPWSGAYSVSDALLPFICYDRKSVSSCQLFDTRPCPKGPANRFPPSCLELCTVIRLVCWSPRGFQEFLTQYCWPSWSFTRYVSWKQNDCTCYNWKESRFQRLFSNSVLLLLSKRICSAHSSLNLASTWQNFLTSIWQNKLIHPSLRLQSDDRLDIVWRRPEMNQVSLYGKIPIRRPALPWTHPMAECPDNKPWRGPAGSFIRTPHQSLCYIHLCSYSPEITPFPTDITPVLAESLLLEKAVGGSLHPHLAWK